MQWDFNKKEHVYVKEMRLSNICSCMDGAGICHHDFQANVPVAKYINTQRNKRSLQNWRGTYVSAKLRNKTGVKICLQHIAPRNWLAHWRKRYSLASISIRRRIFDVRKCMLVWNVGKCRLVLHTLWKCYAVKWKQLALLYDALYGLEILSVTCSYARGKIQCEL